MSSAELPQPSLEHVYRMFRDSGAKRVFIKRLAQNHNSKNQIYLGGDFSVLSVLPSAPLTGGASTSRKPGNKARQILKAPIRLVWLDVEGVGHVAPRAQLILYPQYPEVRLSGLVQGSNAAVGRWFDVAKDGKKPGRILILGVADDGRILAYLATPDSDLNRQIQLARVIAKFGTLEELAMLSVDPLLELMDQIRRIHNLGWIVAKRLGGSGRIEPCRGQNCGGYTLEAELGIKPNGFAMPDYLGWEIKTFSVQDFNATASCVLTVMTPEPDGGLYREKGAEAFVRAFGYADRKGRADRMNFGGVHRFGVRHNVTGLTLSLTGYDAEKGKIQDVNGGFALVSEDKCAASWSFRKLIEHWKKKHEKAAYIANRFTKELPRSYHFAPSAGIGEGADFRRLLSAFTRGELYYDPGLKIEDAGSKAPKTKRRNQFRIQYRHLKTLYDAFRSVGCDR